MHDAQLRTLLSRPSLKKKAFSFANFSFLCKRIIDRIKILFGIGLLYNNKEMNQIPKKNMTIQRSHL